jgi:hypothetical protein
VVAVADCDFRIVVTAAAGAQRDIDLARLADFWSLLNVSDPAEQAAYYVARPLNPWVFKDVWDRTGLYIHASFVTHTAFNYLGKDGDFYDNLSKIYSMDNVGSPNFYFQVSYDGMCPVELSAEDFEVELSFITDIEDYHD